jgi:hypothetical protein
MCGAINLAGRGVARPMTAGSSTYGRRIPGGEGSYQSSNPWGGPTILTPYCSTALLSLSGEICQPVGLGWERSHPAERKRFSWPAGVLRMIMREFVSSR